MAGREIIIRPGAIRAELVQALQEINEQIKVVQDYASNLNIPVYSLRDEHGGWVYIPLLAAKAQVLSALTQNNVK